MHDCVQQDYIIQPGMQSAATETSKDNQLGAKRNSSVAPAPQCICRATLCMFEGIEHCADRLLRAVGESAMSHDMLRPRQWVQPPGAHRPRGTMADGACTLACMNDGAVCPTWPVQDDAATNCCHVSSRAAQLVQLVNMHCLVT